MKDAYTELAASVVAYPHMKRILDMGNQDYDAFTLWLAAALREKGVFAQPSWLCEALNSGDGTYRP